MGQKTKITLTAGILFGIVFTAFSFYYFSETAPWEIPSLHSRRSAKEYCSCRFVIGDSRVDCSKKIFDIIPFGEIEDREESVEMSFLWSTHRAYLENKKLGCKIR
ncbi:MAG: hypothetical protein ACOVP4_10125 [Bacteriovoracaceae bacterium]